MFWQDTWHMDGVVDCSEMYLLVWRGTVVGLERYPWYGVGWKVSHLWKVMLKLAKDRF
jgi:hypothetical protein